MSAPTLGADLLALYQRIEAMTPGDQLRLAAGLIDRGELAVAAALINRLAHDERIGLRAPAEAQR
jgi:hypothetical protein